MKGKCRSDDRLLHAYASEEEGVVEIIAVDGYQPSRYLDIGFLRTPTGSRSTTLRVVRLVELLPALACEEES